MRIRLNKGRTIAVSIRHGRGSDTAAPPKARRKNKSSTRGTQEEHKRNTRGCIPCSWLVPGLRLALVGFAPLFCILHSTFCIRLGVALRWLWGALSGYFAFRTPHSAFPP